MSKARIWMEVKCGCCGDIAGTSRFYNNSTDIRKIKKSVNDWKYTVDYGNTCPECLKKLRRVKCKNAKEIS